MSTQQREGIVVTPHNRLTEQQVSLIDGVSRELLDNPGILSYNPEVVEVFKKAGAQIEKSDEGCARIRIPSDVLDTALKSVPSKITLGARNPDNKLILDAHEPRVRFVTGAETNIWLDVKYDGDTPTYTRIPGSIAKLAQSAHICDNLESCDSFIRNVNIQDEGINEKNKDINKYVTALNNINKHVMASIEDIDILDDLISLGELIAGGKEEFEKNPLLSFITCVVKSPLQIVEDTAYKTMAIAKKKVPLVISSSPMAGTTAPFDEFGMVAQINAEILAGIALTQLVSPGAPVLYGSVPVRTRLDSLNDMYGAPEFVQYNVDCAQMARFYGIPCYSTAGVGDAALPGIQATVEKMLAHSFVPSCGAQYIHYAFGLLDRTNVFCPEQAVLDDTHLDIIKRTLTKTNVTPENRDDTLALIREVMDTSHKTYVYHLPLPTREPVYVAYPLETENYDALKGAHEKVQEINAIPTIAIPKDICARIEKEFKGILPQSLIPFNANKE